MECPKTFVKNDGFMLSVLSQHEELKKAQHPLSNTGESPSMKIVQNVGALGAKDCRKSRDWGLI